MRYDGDRADGVVQERVGDPAELESGESVVAPDSDDQQVGVVRGVQQDPAGAALGGPAEQGHGGMLGRGLAQCRVQDLRGPLLVQAGRFAREQGVVGALVRRAAPGPYGVQGGLAGLGLLEGEPCDLRAVRSLPDSEDHAPVRPGPCLVVLVAAQHDHRARGAAYDLEADRAEQQFGEAAAAARSDDQRGGGVRLVQQHARRVVGQDVGGDRHLGRPAVGRRAAASTMSSAITCSEGLPTSSASAAPS